MDHRHLAAVVAVEGRSVSRRPQRLKQLGAMPDANGPALDAANSTDQHHPKFRGNAALPEVSIVREATRQIGYSVCDIVRRAALGCHEPQHPDG
jgi:hypothetical protein